MTCISSGCRNNPSLKKEQLMAELTKETPKEEAPVIEIYEEYTPAPGIKHQALVKRAADFTRLDILNIIQTKRDIKLSDVAKEVKYYRIREPFAIIRDIIEVPQGYLVLAFPKNLYLFDKDFKKVKVVLEEDIEFDQRGDSYMFRYNEGISNMSYNEKTGIIHFVFSKGYEDSFIVYAHLKELIDNPDARKGRLKSVNENRILSTPNGFLTNAWMSPTMYTFDQRGDTLCKFNLAKDMPPRRGTMLMGESPTRYNYKGNAYFRLPFTDKIYRIANEYTFEEVWQIDFGNKQILPSEGYSTSTNLAEKLMVEDWYESSTHAFVRFTQNYNSKNNLKAGKVKCYQVLYDKRNKQASYFSYKDMTKDFSNIPNDIDGGPSFWPNGVIGTKPYRKIKGKDYKELIKKLPEHTSPLTDVTDEEFIIMTIE